MKLYLSGPMQGYPEYNFPAFERARKLLRDAGYEVVCPAELGKHDGWEWEDYLRRDLKVMLECESVATLPGWENSLGAQLEIDVAGRLRMRVEPVEFWLAYNLSRPIADWKTGIK
jgi:hypothetical protein